MFKYEFWFQLRKLERKYDQKLHSPVRRRLQRIDEWAASIMDGCAATEKVPRWLCNELMHIEDGPAVGRSTPGSPDDLPPAYADLMFHSVLSNIPWGGRVLPTTFALKKGEKAK